MVGESDGRASACAEEEISADKVQEVRSLRSANNDKGAGGPERGARSSAGKSLEGENFKKGCGTKQGRDVWGCRNR